MVERWGMSRSVARLYNSALVSESRSGLAVLALLVVLCAAVAATLG